MIKKLGFIFVSIFVLVLLSPMLIYWWGLSHLETDPIPSQLRLTAEQEQQIWSKEKETGEPRIKSVTPYWYMFSIACIANEGLYASGCMEKYPGLRLSALAVRRQVGDQVAGKGNTVWQFTWMSYTIWVTQHWDIHQILATYNDAYNT